MEPVVLSRHSKNFGLLWVKLEASGGFWAKDYWGRGCKQVCMGGHWNSPAFLWVYSRPFPTHPALSPRPLWLQIKSMYLQISNRTLFAPISLLTSSLAYPSVYFHLHLVTTQYIQMYHAPPRPPDLSEVSRLSKWHYYLTNCSRALLGESLSLACHI